MALSVLNCSSYRTLHYFRIYVIFAQLDALEEGFKVKLDIKQALDQLRSLTRLRRKPRPGMNRSARLFGKDLLSTVDILKRTQGFFKKGEGKKPLAKETLNSFTETASNVLDLENRETWLEVEEVSIKVLIYMHTHIKFMALIYTLHTDESAVNTSLHR
jgi:hypothetical protein